MTIRIATFYKFFPFPDYKTHRQALAQHFCNLGIKGSVLIAEEGLNGTIAGSPVAVETALETLRALPGATEEGVQALLPLIQQGEVALLEQAAARWHSAEQE